MKIPIVLPLSFALTLALLAGCGGTATPSLSTSNVNLIFVTSEDLPFHAPGDINLGTANLTSQGLQRSLLMGTFLKQKVLGGNNVTSIHVLEPMTHLQTANHYPDMAGLQTIQQFAMLNQISLPTGSSSPVSGYSFPIYASYSSGSVPIGVAPPVLPCAVCQGLDFNDSNGDNEALIEGILQANVPGYHVFSAPWETINALMANINEIENYKLALPAGYAGPNYVYAISVSPSGRASLTTYNSNLNPPPTYPEMSSVTVGNACATQTPFQISVIGGSNGAVIPAGTNTNETVYIVRHADAHPISSWDDGNFIGTGQWRALALPRALQGKIQPDLVYAVDPAVGLPAVTGNAASSYVRPAMTVLPYAIANNLPYNIAASVPFLAQNPPQLATYASDYFFTGGTFSKKTILLGWESAHIPITVNALLASYQSSQTVPNWPGNDYDTIWTVKLDSQGNLTVDNALCEGINSATLPATPPPF